MKEIEEIEKSSSDGEEPETSPEKPVGEATGDEKVKEPEGKEEE